MNDKSNTALMARLGALGGALFALGNLLHPLEHGDAAERSATWEAAHLLFGVGAVLICAGIPVITGVIARNRLTRVGTALTWLAMLLIPIGSYFEAYVAPELSEAAVDDIESKAIAFAIVQFVAFMAGPILLGVAAFRTKTWPVLARVGLVVGPVILILTPGLPGADGVWIIAGTAVLGVALAIAGLASARLAGPAPVTDRAERSGQVLETT